MIKKRIPHLVRIYTNVVFFCLTFSTSICANSLSLWQKLTTDFDVATGMHWISAPHWNYIYVYTIRIKLQSHTVFPLHIILIRSHNIFFFLSFWLKSNHSDSCTVHTYKSTPSICLHTYAERISVQSKIFIGCMRWFCLYRIPSKSSDQYTFNPMCIQQSMVQFPHR